MKKRVHDLSTGLVTEVDMTPEEIEAMQPPPVPFDRAAADERMRTIHRPPILNALAGLLAEAVALNETDDVTALLAARQGLKDLPDWLDALPPEQAPMNNEQYDDLCLYRYRQLAAALPEHLRNAFVSAA